MTKTKSLAHWIAVKAPRTYIQSIGGDIKLSATIMSDPKQGPRTTFFNLENWNKLPEPLKGLYSLMDYRQYLVLHEFGHALASLDHPPKKTLHNNSYAPIMYQQTRGLDVPYDGQIIKLKKNLWPLLHERQLFFKKRVY